MTRPLPPALRREIEECLRDTAGEDQRLERVAPVGGGSISTAVRLETDRGLSAFLKWGGAGAVPPGLFAEEARSLAVLSAAGALRVPLVYGTSDPISDDRAPNHEGARWILLEWLEPSRATSDAWRELGSGLADLHAVTEDEHGWPVDNFIGSLRQTNGRHRNWSEFWREKRLEPQIRLAREEGLLDREDGRRFDSLFARLGECLQPAEEDGPSLLHGDLWSGNVHMMDGAVPALVDPASYYGHREADIAMTELFGGFARDFYESYEGCWPLAPGYRPVRRAIYQLYYLLVHVNLFGAGYVGRTRQALAAAGA